MDRVTSTWRSRTTKLRRSFDDNWYDDHYRLSPTGLHGFDHYLKVGARAGYSPNAVFDEQAYLVANSDVADAVAKGQYRSGFEHYVVQGAAEAREARPKEMPSASNTRACLAPLFDEDWYNREYGLAHAPLRGLDHYLVAGARAGYCPNETFDEKFYLAFYRDVRDAVAQRRFMSGFEHYVIVGRLEERMPRHRLDKAIDARFPGLTAPIGVGQADAFNTRMRPLPACAADGDEVIWFLLPAFNPDIFFGGYKSAIELIVALRERGKTVRIVVCAENDDGDYARHLLARDPRLLWAFHDVVILNRATIQGRLPISRHDKIVAYSTWEAHLAHGLAQFTDAKQFAFLVQEYEPVFHGHGAEHALTAAAYDLPHYPIFNSTELAEYFRLHRYGVFAGPRPPVRGIDYALFDHVLTPMDAPSTSSLTNRRIRRLALYARPESHAQRNLFPLALSALRNLIRAGKFAGSWEFHGLGALKPGLVDLGGGEQLYLNPKMSESEYRAFMRSIDIGVSLMYAPHPGLVAFEMASAGARVVTNTFENRTSEHLRALSENIIPCTPTIQGIEEGLATALATMNDIPSRLRGARLRRDNPLPQRWSEVFDDAFFENDMAGYLGNRNETQIDDRMIA